VIKTTEKNRAQQNEKDTDVRTILSAAQSMTKSALTSVLLITICFSSSNLHAFYVTKHNDYTHLAYEKLKQCGAIGVDMGLSVDVDVEHIGNGAEWEDTTELISRSLNWHFYKSNNDIEDTWFTHRTFGPIYEKRVQQFLALLDSRVAVEDILVASGRVLHYMQDVAVPAHVVPVLHGPFPFPDDEFDSYELGGSGPSAKDPMLSFTEQECRDLFQTQLDLTQIISQAAQQTLKAIQAPIRAGGENPINTTWSAYWQADDSWFLSGFGSYGVVGNRFGEELTLENCNSDDCTITKKDYDRFYRQQLKQALYHTAHFILLVDRKLRTRELTADTGARTKLTPKTKK